MLNRMRDAVAIKGQRGHDRFDVADDHCRWRARVTCLTKGELRLVEHDMS